MLKILKKDYKERKHATWCKIKKRFRQILDYDRKILFKKELNRLNKGRTFGCRNSKCFICHPSKYGRKHKENDLQYIKKEI